MSEIIEKSNFLVIGAAGSIGREVAKLLFSYKPKKLHIVDISENNLAELVRDIRSEYGYISGEFRALTLDVSSEEYDSFIKSDGVYDYVLNLSALKHVRSEKDPYTLMRLVRVNILNTIKTINQSIDSKVKKYFCVSTDKASNPVNLMGASKLIMEMFLSNYSHKIDISSARFANVAFSDGSLLDSFDKRIKKKQPIVAPKEIERYFITPEESGILCVMSCLFGLTREIFYPKIQGDFRLIKLSEVAERYLQLIGLNPLICSSEEEARGKIKSIKNTNDWPLFLSDSDTTGEKGFEEFYTHSEKINNDKFENIGIISNSKGSNIKLLEEFQFNISCLLKSNSWSKEHIVKEFMKVIPDLNYQDKGKYLDEKM